MFLYHVNRRITRWLRSPRGNTCKEESQEKQKEEQSSSFLGKSQDHFLRDRNHVACRCICVSTGPFFLFRKHAPLNPTGSSDETTRKPARVTFDRSISCPAPQSLFRYVVTVMPDRTRAHTSPWKRCSRLKTTLPSSGSSRNFRHIT